MKLLVYALALVAVHTALAEIHFVSPGMSVQEAVNGAAPGDSVVLEDGLHYATVVPYGRDVVIGSRYLLDGDTMHISATVVQPDFSRPDTQSCFVYAYGESPASRLVGLCLANGRGTDYIHTSHNPSGGAVYVVAEESSQANVTMDYCRIEFSRADEGGGIYIRGWGWGSPVGVVMNHSTISGCSASSYGGGVLTWMGTLTARNCVFKWDTLDTGYFPMPGSALMAVQSHVILDSCEFTLCAGTEAAVAFADFCTGTVGNCSFHENVILYGDGAAAADLLFTYCYLSVNRCHFDLNFSGSPAASLGGEVPYSFVGNVVENGVATISTGAIGLAGNRGNIGYNIIRNYVNAHGGTINSHSNGMPSPQVRVHHNTITGNVSLDTLCPSVLTTIDLWPLLDSNQISGNSGNTIGPNPNYPEGIINARNNWWGHPSGPYHPTLNPAGQGDTLLSDSVLFIPWLTEPPDTTMPPNYLTVRERPEIARTWVLMDAYPNPFNQSVTLVLAGFTGQDFEIGLYNLLGQIVDVVHHGALTGGQLHYQAPPWLASGVYLLSARDKHSVQTKKVVLLK
jgi:hypothetical protein